MSKQQSWSPNRQKNKKSDYVNVKELSNQVNQLAFDVKRMGRVIEHLDKIDRIEKQQYETLEQRVTQVEKRRFLPHLVEAFGTFINVVKTFKKK